MADNMPDTPATLNMDAIEDGDWETVEVPDTQPLPTSSVPTCEVCGTVLAYSGRGRKPKRCEEHKTRRTASTLGKTRSTGSVAQAATTLDMLYGMVSMGLFMIGAHSARDALETSLPGLHESNLKYLAQDADLVKRINSVGKISGRAGFIGAQVMTLGPVAVLAYAELAEKRPARPASTGTPGPVPATMGGFPIG